MKLFLTLISCIAIANSTLSQDFIYKRNLNGEIEVYQSSYGVPQGQPLGKFKRDVYGYMEYQSLNTGNNYFYQSTNPTTELPTLTPVTPQYAPVASILNSLNVYQQVLLTQRKQQAQQTYSDDGLNALKQHYQAMTEQFQYLKDFYTKVNNKPTKVNNGWHRVVLLSDEPLKDIMKTAQITADKKVEIGYALVTNNTIQKLIVADNLGGANYLEPDIISSDIDNCKALYAYKDGSGTTDNEVYFLNFILDTAERTSPPQLGAESFTLGSGATKVAIGIFKQNPLLYPESQNVCILVLIRSNDGLTVNGINQFISLPGTYYYHAMDVNNGVWDGNFTLYDNSQSSITISYK